MKYQWHDYRKKQRLNQRKNFLKEVDVTPTHDAADIQEAFREYQKRAVEMISDIHDVMSPDDVSFMREVKVMIADLDLGIPDQLGTTPFFRSASNRYNALASNWFVDGYSHGGMIARQIFGE